MRAFNGRKPNPSEKPVHNPSEFLLEVSSSKTTTGSLLVEVSKEPNVGDTIERSKTEEAHFKREYGECYISNFDGAVTLVYDIASTGDSKDPARVGIFCDTSMLLIQLYGIAP